MGGSPTPTVQFSAISAHPPDHTLKRLVIESSCVKLDSVIRDKPKFEKIMKEEKTMGHSQLAGCLFRNKAAGRTIPVKHPSQAPLEKVKKIKRSIIKTKQQNTFLIVLPILCEYSNPMSKSVRGFKNAAQRLGEAKQS